MFFVFSYAALASLALLIVGSVAYTALYRLYLDPLANIPGPRLAALTFYYEIYFNVVKPGMFVWEIQRLHTVYGPIVRINPREVHVSDLSFLDEIYSTSRPRDKDEYATSTLDMKLSLGGTCRHEIQKVRRAALTPFFSKPGVTKLESVVAKKVKQFCGQLDAYKVQSLPVNLSDAYFALSQDVVKQYGFGYDEDLLGDLKRAAAARKNLNAFMFNTHFNVHFGWMNIPLVMLPQKAIKALAPGLDEFMQFQKKVRAQVAEVLSNTETDYDKNDQEARKTIFYELRDSPMLPPEEKSLDRLMHEGLLLVAAGSEATAKSLYVIQYHLLANPPIMDKLRSELKTLPPDASWAELEKLPYLTAIITEGNRLNFGVTMRNCRVAPTDTLHYGKYVLPPGTPVSTMSLFVNTSEEFYPNPWAFDPERWLGPGAMERRKYMTSFGKGTRRCIGVNLAHMVLYLAIAAVARYDLELFETDISDVEFRHEYMTFQPKMGSKGVRAVVKGRIGGS